MSFLHSLPPTVTNLSAAPSPHHSSCSLSSPGLFFSGPCCVSYLCLAVLHHSPTIIAWVCWVDLSKLQNNSFLSQIALERNPQPAATRMGFPVDAAQPREASLCVIKLIPLLIKSHYWNGSSNIKHKLWILKLCFTCLDNRLLQDKR